MKDILFLFLLDLEKAQWEKSMMSRFRFLFLIVIAGLFPIVLSLSAHAEIYAQHQMFISDLYP